MQNNFCAVKGRRAEDTECSGIICNADELTMGVCRTCLRGKALLAAAKPAMEQTRLIPQPLLDEQSTDEAKLDELKADEAPATSPTPPTAWAKIQRATGCATYGQLAAITGHSVSALRQQVMRLQYGKLPRRDNDVIPAIMRAGKFTLQDLIPGAPHIDFLPSSRPVCDPATSSPPSLSGSDTSAEPDGTIGSTDAQAAYDAAGAAIGVDLPAPFEQGLYAEGTAMDLGTKTSPTIPADFLPYQGVTVRADKPVLRFNSEGDSISISAGAVRAFGLEGVERVRLYWSPQRSQMGILPTGAGGLKMQPTRHSQSRVITARAFLREFGLSPAKGPHPISLDPSGLIVATITQQPSQGGEA